MKGRNIWALISTLSSREVRQFRYWLQAELENRQQFVQQLYDLLATSLPHPPDRIEVWKQLYPNKAFDDARLRKLTR
ncbi:MAG: hypothetical protein AAF206_24275, partial [Bacteroidota bacterium]